MKFAWKNVIDGGNDRWQKPVRQLGDSIDYNAMAFVLARIPEVLGLYETQDGRWGRGQARRCGLCNKA